MKLKVVKAGECGDAVRLYNGDCLDILKSIPDNSIDLVVTDPPYVIETKGAGIYKQADKQYVKDTEFILFFREKGVRLYGEFKTKRTFYITPLNQKDKKLYKHPTCKPVEILRNLIINSSLENDVVLDPFLGSGSTGVACKNTDRKFIGIEINKEYFNTAKERIDRAMLCSN